MSDNTNQFTDEDVNLAVKRGAYWLDENYPGWEKKIRLRSLVMNNCGDCIIGQAVGDFYDTIQTASGNVEDGEDWAIENGFQSPNFYNYGYSSASQDFEAAFDFAAEHAYYRASEVVWSDEVRKRLG